MAIQEPFVDPTTGEAIQSLAAGGRVVDVLHAKTTLDYGSIAANVSADLNITVIGARPNDCVVIAPQSTLNGGLTVTAYVSSNDTVTVRVANNTAGAINPAAGTWRAMVYKFAEGV